MKSLSLKSYYHHKHRPDYVFSGHRHYDCELNALFSGEMEVTCDDKVFKISAGDFILLPPHSFHRNRVLGESIADMIVVQFISEDPAFCTSPRAAMLSGDEASLLSVFCRDIEKSSERKNGELVKHSESSAKLFDVFIEYITESENAYKERECPNPIYETAIKFMNERVCDILRISDIAKECNVCPTKLKNVFSHYTGKGCMEFFGELKLEAAKRLLSEGKTCAECAELLGFSSQGYFSKKFKNQYGITPIKFKLQ